MSAKKVALIAAMGTNRVIGRDGGIPWRIPEDLRHFKERTLGHAIVMGRKTYESVNKPLPGRRNIVVSSTLQAREGVEVVRTLGEALRLAWSHDDEPWVIGGEGVYREALPLATKLMLTYVDYDGPGDAFFPPFDEAAFRETERREGATPGVVFVTYERP